ncbi:MAG: hypothetical protein WA110_10595, partial [Anaerolineaceae bacterium]
MNEQKLKPPFEEEVFQSYQVPPLRPEFADQLHTRIIELADEKPRKSKPFFKLHPAWTTVIVILAVMIIGTFVIGPQKVYATMLRLFGYIPGVGLVEESGSLRILKEPVQVTRDGITVSVNQAVLNETETQLNYGVSGVPLSAYPKEESNLGCLEKEYLRLPDGSQVDINAPIPADVNEATFVLPCIFNTLPTTAPTDWELPLYFIPAPSDFVILPVIDITPQETPTDSAPGMNGETLAANATAPAQAVVSVDQFIETEEGYILLGTIHPNLPEGRWLQITGAAVLRDADGKNVSYSFPVDVQHDNSGIAAQGDISWSLQFKGAGVKFPLTISFSGVVISQVDPEASASLSIDVGANPQPEQVWEVNQDLQLAGYTIRLVSVTAQADGYSFRIDPGTDLSGVSVEIEGYQAVGGGGGWLQGPFNTSLVYSTLPNGILNLVFANPVATGPTETWQTTWQPETLHEFSTSPATADLCWNADTIQNVPTLPEGLDGKVLFTRLNPAQQTIMANFDGSDQLVLVEGNASVGLGFSQDEVFYTNDQGLLRQNIDTGATTVVPGSFGRDALLSPDGTRIADVNTGGGFGAFIIGSDGSVLKQLSDLGYESLAGWSPDGSQLYYAIPGSSGDGFLLRSVNVETGDTEDLFVLENSSGKAPMPAISPDGKWIAYRARDNSSLYLKGMDGSPARLLLDNPATAINGLAWESAGHFLAVSLITSADQEGEMLLIAPDSCETYRLSGMNGA